MSSVAVCDLKLIPRVRCFVSTIEHSVGKWQDEYKPTQWLPLLQATVAGARLQEEGEATISLQLLATAAEAGEDFVALHVPAITAAVQGEISKHIPPHPEPWPQVRSTLLAVSRFRF
jgi:hypothetical protein